MTNDTHSPQQIESPPLYKRDSKGKVRVWYMEQDGDRYRTFDGVEGGKVKASGWRTAKPTNVNRSNARDGVAQAAFEIEAAYTKQLKGAYYRDVADIDRGCRYTEPQLLEKYEDFAPGDVQPKLDGFRCVMESCGAMSREGELFPGVMHIHESLVPIFERAPQLKIDGEAYNHALGKDFNKLGSLIKKGAATPAQAAEAREKIQFHVYDILGTGKPWSERKLILEKLVAALNNPSIILVETVPVETAEEYDALHVAWVENSYEGSVWRDRDGLYEEGKRSKGARKRKDFDDAEFDIIPDGIEAGEGNWADAAKRVVCWLPNADRTIDLNDKKAREANTFEAGLRGEKPDNIKLLAERDQHKVVTIRFFGWTPSAIPKPRFGVATHFHGAARTM